MVDQDDNIFEIIIFVETVPHNVPVYQKCFFCQNIFDQGGIIDIQLI
jgi:hypothetical protein